ncbi:MAG TPA: potassium channel family protein [Bryobacteraceae bacterium]|nr:potassium channel family protein [Bryobacteraceae bacterium]
MTPSKEKLNAGLEILVMMAAMATIPVVVLEGRGMGSQWTELANWVIWFCFLIALFVGTLQSENRLAHLRRHPIDLLVVILSFPMLPELLALSRMARFTRLLRVVRVVVTSLRSMRALKATIGRRELLYVGSLCVVLVVTASITLVVLEPETVGGSFANALWWSAVTVTTVGYGDISPTTTISRVAAIVIMLAGLGVISTLSASIAAYFIDQGKQSELDQLHERLERIEALLQQQVVQRRDTGGGDSPRGDEENVRSRR